MFSCPNKTPNAPFTPIRKVVISEFGDVSKVHVEESTIPPPCKGEVQVAPLYAGFSGADVNMRQGVYPLQRKAPLTPGYCLVGTVVQTTSSAFQLGDLVASLTVYDAEATLVNLPAKHVVHVPAGVSPRHGTALVLDWATAYAMVFQTADVQPGQRVFVHGLSGAVGSALLALCRLRGASVYGTASPRNHEVVLAAGAAAVFDYSNKGWMGAMQALGGVHAVFDPLGFRSWDESYEILATNGESAILVGYGSNLQSLPGSSPSSGGNSNTTPSGFSTVGPMVKLLLRNTNLFTKRRTAFYYITRDDSAFQPNLHALFALAQEGKINVNIKNIWRMEDIREAHRSWGKDAGIGSYLIQVASDEVIRDVEGKSG
ncbi:zinc-binding dehydrogenase [Biscogniauxia mediterranea]|nr:zinc-binding dehydrogenase [Biscogniauxia mediterranea]